MITLKNIIKRAKRHLRSVQIYFYYFRNISFSAIRDKEIIIVFDGMFSHGGLVDRLKGIISFYQIALRTGSKFKINFTHPFDLSIFLEPNMVDWRMTNSRVPWNPFQTKILYLMDYFSFDALQYIDKSKKKRFIVYCNIDYTSKLYSGATEAEIDSHWSNSFKALFQRSEFLNSALLAQRLAQDRIAVHTRFTALLADFQDSTTKYISETRKSEIMASLLRKIDTIGNRNGSTKIYVFSDSIKFLNYIRFNSDYLVLEGTPAHLDIHSEDLKMELHLKTFIDFFAIAESDEIVLLKTKEMYHSAFPKYASKIYGRKFSLIETL